MKRSLSSSRSSAGGFTLVEILVSITVLGLMMIGVAQMLNSAMAATLGGYRHMDADTQARMVLDRMAYDISKISRRSDLDYYFKKNNGGGTTGANDQMAFFSEAGGYFPTATTTQQSTMALVGYRINSATNQLERLSKGLVWNGAISGTPAMVFGATATMGATINSNWPNVEKPGAGGDTDYQAIGDQIFRLEYCFLVVQTNFPTLYNSNQATPPTVTTASLSEAPYSSPDTTANGSLPDVTAIVVSIAVLDTSSQLAANSVSATAMANAATKLEDAKGTTIATNALPLTLWKADLASNNLGLPKSIASQVRFYQRYCYLPHVQ